ncbi:MAG: tetratricopeptide repeat protein, partial [Rhodopirellula bahusiensis]
MPSSAQEVGETDRERVTADRFFQVLLRRPRPGTALDRVYGYHVQNGSLDQLIESLDVDDDAPSAGEKAMVLGLIQAQRGKSALAVEAFSKAEKRLPDEAACSFYLGKSLLAVGENERAAAAIQRAIDRGPARNEAVPIFTELGRIYGRAGQNEKAFAVWKQLEAMFPRDARVGGQIARALAEEGNLEEAL